VTASRAGKGTLSDAFVADKSWNWNVFAACWTYLYAGKAWKRTADSLYLDFQIRPERRALTNSLQNASHRSGYNVTFCDGHVALVKRADFLEEPGSFGVVGITITSHILERGARPIFPSRPPGQTCPFGGPRAEPAWLRPGLNAVGCRCSSGTTRKDRTNTSGRISAFRHGHRRTPCSRERCGVS